MDIVSGQPAYGSSKNNGIKSRFAEGTDFGLKFSAKNADGFEPYNGMMVDVLDKEKKRVGIVNNIIGKSKGVYKLMVEVEGIDEGQIMAWPSEKLQFCGRLFPNRKCDKKSKDPREAFMFEKKFCFTRLKECGEGYIPDNGGLIHHHESF